MAKLGRTVGSTWLVGAVCIALAATVACGGDDDEPGGGQTGGSGGSGGTNAAGASGTGGTAAVGGSAGSAGEAGSSGQAGSAGSTGDTLEVDVFTRDPNDPSKLVPATGAIVAFDLPGGTRVEESVGASETVSFSGIDWSLEPKAAVTAYQQGAMLMSYAGLSKEGVDVLNQLRGQDRLTFVLGSEPLSLVNVAGTASNMASESDVLLVSATIPAAISEAYGTDFSLSVVAGLQFSLVGLEYHGYAASPSGRGMQFTIDQWAELSQDAAMADVLDVAFDLSNQLAPNTVTGSFAIPEHGSSGFFESAHGMVRTSSVGSRETGIFGYATEIEVADDEKSFEYTAQYVEPADAPLLFTHYLLFGEDGSTGSFFRPGPIGAGLQDGVPPEPVHVTSASDTPGFARSQPINDPIVWENNSVDAADDGLAVNMGLQNATTKATVWFISAPPTVTEISVPALPTGADPDAVLGAGSLSTTIELCELQNPEDYANWCSRHARSEPITLTR